MCILSYVYITHYSSNNESLKSNLTDQIATFPCNFCTIKQHTQDRPAYTHTHTHTHVHIIVKHYDNAWINLQVHTDTQSLLYLAIPIKNGVIFRKCSLQANTLLVARVEAHQYHNEATRMHSYTIQKHKTSVLSEFTMSFIYARKTYKYVTTRLPMLY